MTPSEWALIQARATPLNAYEERSWRARQEPLKLEDMARVWATLAELRRRQQLTALRALDVARFLSGEISTLPASPADSVGEPALAPSVDPPGADPEHIPR